MFCQLVYLRRCIPGRIRRALDELPETLDGTYARTLEEIDDQNWEYAHRLFQCVAAASRPFVVNELAEFLAFDFNAGPTPTFLADWRPEDPAHTVLSMCSSLLVLVKPGGGLPVVQFAHFSVKEYLTSIRLAEAKDTISRFHVSMTPAHTIVAQACLGALLHLDKNVTKDSLEKFPLAEYAAEHWMGHARFENGSSNVQDGMKQLFNPSKRHLSIWVWIYDPEDPRRRRWRSKRPVEARATPLHYAAFCGIYDIAAFLIVEHSQDINALGFDEETPLHVASRQGHADVAQLLLEHGADSEVKDGDKCSPLVLASQGGHVEVAQVLLERGANTETRDGRKRITSFLASEDGYVVAANGHDNDTNQLDRTPLLLASQLGHVELARVLLKHGTNKEARDNGFRTPLLLASQVGHVEVARVLLEHGADTGAKDKFNCTPLLLALSFRYAEVAQVLLKHDADANVLGIDVRHRASEHRPVEASRVHSEDGVDAKTRDAKWVTPLHLALEHGLVEVAQALLEHDVDANARNSKNATMLHLASKHGHMKVIQFLLKNGVDANPRNAKNATPLHLASEYGHVETTQVLLEHGVDANTRDANRATPLHLASEYGHVEIAQVLLKHGVDANTRDANRATPLHLASEYRHVEIAQVLLEHGVDANARGAKDATPLHLALKHGRVNVSQALPKFGIDSFERSHLESKYKHWKFAPASEHVADVNTRDAKKVTLLPPVAEQRLVQLVRVLLKHGADANARDAKNMTPSHLASQHGYVEVSRFLLEYDVDANIRDTKNAAPFPSRMHFRHARPDSKPEQCSLGEPKHAPAQEQ